MSYKNMRLASGMATAMAVLCAALTLQAGPLKVGDKLPDLAKKGVSGDIPDMKGKVVLVDFWASWCGPCKISFPAMEKLFQRFKDKDFLIVAISVDEKPEAMKEFLKDKTVTFTVLHDAKQKLVEAAGIETMPTSFLINKAGKIVAVHNGFKKGETEEQMLQEVAKLLGATEKGK